jgi:hypothetical protein
MPFLRRRFFVNEIIYNNQRKTYKQNDHQDCKIYFGLPCLFFRLFAVILK